VADDRKSEVSQAGDQTKLSAAASIGVDEGAPPIRIIDVDRAPVGVVVQGLSLVGVLRIDEADRQPSGPRVEHAEHDPDSEPITGKAVLSPGERKHGVVMLQARGAAVQGLKQHRLRPSESRGRRQVVHHGAAA
jgi:hypothetical protein